MRKNSERSFRQSLSLSLPIISQSFLLCPPLFFFADERMNHPNFQQEKNSDQNAQNYDFLFPPFDLSEKSS